MLLMVSGPDQSNELIVFTVMIKAYIVIFIKGIDCTIEYFDLSVVEECIATHLKRIQLL